MITTDDQAIYTYRMRAHRTRSGPVLRAGQLNERGATMVVLHEVSGFLGEKRRAAVLRLLQSPTLKWERSDRLGRTTSGRMWQLANSAMHRRPEVMQLSTLMASIVYDEVHRTMPDLLPDSSRMVPQVFPVRMEGNDEEPPAQRAHQDEAGGRNPLVTSLYYAAADSTVGGALALHDDQGRIRARVSPTADQLVVIGGRQIHSVEPLTTGRRITIVTNFYDV